MMILSADIGGTTSRLKITNFSGSSFLMAETIKSNSYDNDQYNSFYEVLEEFLAKEQLRISAVCLGVAGAVVDDQVKLTNRNWHITVKELRRYFDGAKIKLINDFVAIGYGLEFLGNESLITLQAGVVEDLGLKAYLGAGTGLGMGFCCTNQLKQLVYSSEGGHASFAPTSREQMELLEFLVGKYQQVSIERLLSGNGLVDLYYFMASKSTVFNDSYNLEVCYNLSAEVVNNMAISGEDHCAIRAVELFVEIYGSVAGNLALTLLPFGGLYLVGGVTNRLKSMIVEKSSLFLTSFLSKEKSTCLLKSIPVYLVVDTEVGLNGAMWYVRASL